MDAKLAAQLKPGTRVTVPFGTGGNRRRVEGVVVSATAPEPWGRGMRPANATPETLLSIVTVELGGRRGRRSFGNDLVEVVR